MNRILVVAAAVVISFSAHTASAAQKTYIIGFTQKPGNSEKQLIEGRKGKVRKELQALPMIIADLSDEDAAALRQEKGVAYVEENVLYSLPVEPMAASTEYVDSWGVGRIGAEAAHLRGIRGAGVKVGIIDSGIDVTSAELAPNYKGGFDCVFNDLVPNDENGHGTHVAGIVAAKGDGTGIVGVAPDADIYAIRVLDGGGFGSSAWLMCGLDWAISNGMNVINLSNGTSLGSVALQDAASKAYAAGIVVVAAAGNYSAGGRDLALYPIYPACYDGVIAVSATDSNDLIAAWSNFGSKVELAAPGVNILSTWLAGTTKVVSGTSQAAPHVAGAAALLLSAGVQDVNGDGNLVDDVRSLLDSTTRELGAPGRDPYYGYGLVDVSWVGADMPERFTLAGGTSVPVAKTLPTGNYTIQISNLKLDRLKVARSVLKDRSWPMTLKFNGRAPQIVSLDVAVTAAEETFSLTPYGSKGTSATITIRKK